MKTLLFIGLLAVAVLSSSRAKGTSSSLPIQKPVSPPIPSQNAVNTFKPQIVQIVAPKGSVGQIISVN